MLVKLTKTILWHYLREILWDVSGRVKPQQGVLTGRSNNTDWAKEKSLGFARNPASVHLQTDCNGG
jgi:hypothetical protein